MSVLALIRMDPSLVLATLDSPEMVFCVSTSMSVLLARTIALRMDSARIRLDRSPVLVRLDTLGTVKPAAISMSVLSNWISVM